MDLEDSMSMLSFSFIYGDVILELVYVKAKGYF